MVAEIREAIVPPIKAFIPNSDNVFDARFEESNFNVELESFFYTLEFENMLSNYYIYGRIQNVRLNDVKNKMIDMIALIDRVLKS